MNLRSWLVRLYPRRWRERYGEEFDALLEECLHSPLDALDIFLGALDAHLGFPYEMNWRLTPALALARSAGASVNMVNKLRTSILIVFAAYIGFIVGGMGFYGLVDDSPAAALMKTTDVPLFAAWNTVQAGALIALLAVVAGGLPIAWIAIRRAVTTSRRDLRYLLVPVFAFLALVLYAGFMASIAFNRLRVPGVLPVVSPDNFPIGNRLLIGGAMLVFVLGAIASTAAVWKVISSTDTEEGAVGLFGLNSPVKLYGYAFVLAVVVALAMLLMLVATLAFGWLAYSVLPQWFASDRGLLLTGTSASFAVIIAVMAASTAIAFFGLARGYSARRPA